MKKYLWKFYVYMTAGIARFIFYHSSLRPYYNFILYSFVWANI